VTIARVALDVPLHEAFDFRVPEGAEIPAGALVVVPFGRSRRVGVVVAHARRTEVPPSKLRDIERRVDDVPPIAAAELELYEFCARYYQRPLGEVIATALPPRLRQVSRRSIPAQPVAAPHTRVASAEPALTPEQQAAVERINAAVGGFHAVLLHGITGSGKTEVYLRAIAAAIARGAQALFLVPEIGLTPQLEDLVRGRFPHARVAPSHKSPGRGRTGRRMARSAIGARRTSCSARGLAVLMPFPQPRASSWSMRSTTRRTSSRRACATRRATSRCGRAQGLGHPHRARIGHSFARELLQCARWPLPARDARLARDRRAAAERAHRWTLARPAP
jgi:primosomal protein N' (replication factor Y)